MAAAPRRTAHILAVGVAEQSLAHVLASSGATGYVLTILDGAAKPTAPRPALQADIIVAELQPGEANRRFLAECAAAARFGLLTFCPDGTKPDSSVPGILVTETELAEGLATLLAQMAASAASDRADSEPPTHQGAAPSAMPDLAESLMSLAQSLDPGDDLPHFLDGLSNDLRQLLAAEVVEVELSSPPQHSRSPRRADLPSAPLSLKDLAQHSASALQRRLPGGNWQLLLPLRTPRRTLGVLTVVGREQFSGTTLLALRFLAGQVAARLDIVRLSLEHRRSLDELQAISDIGRSMMATFSLDRILDMIVHTALRFVPKASRAVIHMPDDARENLVPQAQAGDPEGAASLVLPWGKGIAGRVAQERRPIYVPDAASHPDFVAGTTFVRSLVVAPLLLGQAVIGTLSISSPARDAFGERDIRILSSLASQAAVAVENARLHSEARKADEVAALYELGQALNSSLDLQQTVTTILSSARSLTFASAAEVRLVSPVDESLEAVIALGDRPQSMPGDRYRMSVLYPRLALERKQPLLVEDTLTFELNDEFCRHEPPTWLRSYLGIRLETAQRVVGILSLGSDSPGAFSSEDLRLLRVVAGQAATALSNARLYDQATQRLREAEALARVSRSIAASFEQASLLQSVVDTVLGTIGLASHSFAYLLPNEGKPMLAAQAPALSDGENGPDTGVWEWCADGCLVRGQPVSIEDTLRHGFPSLRSSGPHSVMAVPMVAGGKLVGVLGADSSLPNAFSQGDLHLLQAFADQAATAVESARLFNDLNRAYRDLARSTETLSAVFDGITDGMYIVDSAGKLVMVNEPEAAFLARQPESLAGADYAAYYHSSGGSCEHCTVMEALATGTHQSLIISYVNPEGHQTWREIDAYPIRDREGLTDRVVVFTRDVTGRRRMEASLYESSKLASIGQLASSIAHEINNPLTVIIGNAEVLLLDIPEDSPLRDTIEMILRAARRAARIVDNLLNLSSQRDYEMSEVDLEANLQEALELVGHPLRRANIQPELSITEDVPLIVASANHLKVVWMNLLLNARDAIVRSGRTPGKLSVTVERESDNMVRITVSDNGPGIAADERARLFQPFYTTKPAGEGLGLGLYNAYNIVRQHHGEIEVVSEPGQGATFIIRLPVDPGTD